MLIHVGTYAGSVCGNQGSSTDGVPLVDYLHHTFLIKGRDAALCKETFDLEASDISSDDEVLRPTSSETYAKMILRQEI